MFRSCRPVVLVTLAVALACTDQPTEPTLPEGPVLRAPLPPPPPNSEPVVVAVPPPPPTGIFNIPLGTYASPTIATITIDGEFTYTALPGTTFYPGTGSADARGLFVGSVYQACYLQVQVGFSGQGGLFPGGCTTTPFHQGHYQTTTVLQGVGIASRSPGIPQFGGDCGGRPCHTYSGTQVVTVTPAFAELALTLTPATMPWPAGQLRTVRAAAVPATIAGRVVPVVYREWRFAPLGEAPQGGATTICVPGTHETCQVTLRQSGTLTLEAIVNGRLVTESLFLAVQGGDSMPPAPPDTVPVDSIPSDTTGGGGGDGGGCGVAAFHPALRLTCEPPQDSSRVISIVAATGAPIVSPVLANRFNAITQTAFETRSDSIQGRRAARSDVLLFDIRLRTSGGNPIGGPVWVISSPLNGSGGHVHGTARAADIRRPRGTFFAPTATSEAWKSPDAGTRDSVLLMIPDSGHLSVRYRTSGIGGIEALKVRALSHDTTVARDSINVLIEVPDLVSIPHQGAAYRYIASDNHPGHDDYAFPGVGAMLDSILAGYQAKHDSFPEIYPMSPGGFTIDALSLELGGLYDIGAATGQVWQYPHQQHRDGLDVDVNNAVAENYPIIMQTVCGQYYFHLSATDSLQVYCHHETPPAPSHYHIYFGPRR